MYFDYFDMLSGEPVWMEGVGHLKSPLLRDICPSSGISHRGYNFYLNLLTWDKTSLLKYDKLMEYRGADKLRREQLNTFDVATLLPQTRDLYLTVLSFFIVEHLEWNEKARRFEVVANPEDAEHPRVLLGTIDRTNFEDVRQAILQLNFVGLDKDEAPLTHSSDKSKELWDQVQQHLAKQANSETKKESKPEYRLSNIISKLCSVHPSYNLLNVFGLTIFQLYDAFFQVGYMRSADLSEQIFSNHGGEHFHFEDWLKPVLDIT